LKKEVGVIMKSRKSNIREKNNFRQQLDEEWRKTEVILWEAYGLELSSVS
jgi:hypothetical protein